jgi:EmrB/QacA subfamily drug resistance transporter
VVLGSLQFSAGVLGDRWGRRRVLLIGLSLFGMASLAASFAADPNQLIAFRGLKAVGAAMVLPQTLSILTNVFPPEERPRAIGVWTGFTGASLALGPILGGLLLEHFWWGSIFFINVPIVAVTIVAVIALVPETRNPSPARLDPLGIVLSIIGLGALLFGLVTGGQTRDWTSVWSLGVMILGLIVLGLFVVSQARSDHPSFDVRFFRNPRFSAATTAGCLAFFALFGTTFFLTFYYQFVKDMSPLQAGLAVLPVGIAQVVFAPRSPAVVARFGPKFTVAFGLTLLAVSFGGYLLIDTGDPVWQVLVLAFLTGVAMAHIVAPATESVMSTLPPATAGAGAAVNNTVRQTSGALGIAVFGTVLQVVYARQIQPSLDALPAAVRDQAGRSIGDTVVAVDRLTATDPGAGQAASDALGCGTGQACAVGDAFMAGVHVTAIIAACVALVGVAVVLRWLPRRSLPRDFVATMPRGEATVTLPDTKTAQGRADSPSAAPAAPATSPISPGPAASRPTATG